MPIEFKPSNLREALRDWTLLGLLLSTFLIGLTALVAGGVSWAMENILGVRGGLPENTLILIGSFFISIALCIASVIELFQTIIKYQINIRPYLENEWDFLFTALPNIFQLMSFSVFVGYFSKHLIVSLIIISPIILTYIHRERSKYLNTFPLGPKTIQDRLVVEAISRGTGSLFLFLVSLTCLAS